MKRGVFEGLFICALAYTVIFASSMPARAHETVVYPVRAWEGMKEDTLMDTARKSVLGALRSCREELNNERSYRNDDESYLGEAWCDSEGTDEYQGDFDEAGTGYEDGAEAEDTGAVEGGEEWFYYGNCRITFYDDCAECCGVAGNTTASGVYPTPQHTVATGGDLPFGTVLLIDGQEYVVEDRGVDAYEVDIFVATHDEALARGLYYADVFILE